MQHLELLTLKSLVGRATADRELALRELDATRCTAADFEGAAPRALFLAIERRLRNGEALEAVSLHAATSKDVPRGMLVDVMTGSEYLGLEPRARLVRERSQRRKAITALDVVRQMLADETNSLPVALAEGQKVLGAFAPEDSDVRHAETDVMAQIDRLEAVQSGRLEACVPTGISALDFALGGGLPPTLVIVGALPGVGKSSLLAAVAGNMMARASSVGVLSLEDERGWVLRRLAARGASVPLFVFGKKPLGPQQLARAGDALETLHSHAKHLVMSDASGGVATVVARARQMVAAGCKAILVDHLGEVRLERSDRHDLDIMNALQELRGIAKSFGIPVVVASHLKRRDGLTVFKAPMLTDFAFSSAVERMARVALGLYLEEGDRNRLNVAVLKQTEGPANAEFSLNVAAQYGLVDQTEVTQGLRDFFGVSHE